MGPLEEILTPQMFKTVLSFSLYMFRNTLFCHSSLIFLKTVELVEKCTEHNYVPRSSLQWLFEKSFEPKITYKSCNRVTPNERWYLFRAIKNP
jgi:hypothetical protein